MQNSFDPAILVGVVGLVITVTQILFNRSRMKSEETFRLIEKLNSVEARASRFSVNDLMTKAANHNDDFHALSDNDRSELSSVAALFGYVGILGKKGKIDLPLIIDLWGDVIVSNWEKLSPYRKHLESRFGKAIGHWEYFEWLSSEVESRKTSQ